MKKEYEYRFKPPSMNYKLRCTTSKGQKNLHGDAYVLTVPRHIASEMLGTYFELEISGTTLIYKSGCQPNQEESSKEE